MLSSFEDPKLRHFYLSYSEVVLTQILEGIQFRKVKRTSIDKDSSDVHKCKSHYLSIRVYLLTCELTYDLVISSRSIVGHEPG